MPRSGNRSSSSRSSASDWGVMEIARDRPMAAAAVAAGAAAAGLFLWSRRSQISNQISNLSDQIGEWTENMGSGSWSQDDDTGGLTSSSQASARSSGSRSSGSRGRSTSSQRGMSETGGGNASLGRTSGGGGSMSSPSGRGRAQQAPTT
jgi:hypothetical protein